LLRIHFTCEDLARVTIAAAPDPLWEVMLSLRVLAAKPADARFPGWRRHTLTRLAPPARELVAVARSAARWPDLLTPTCGGVRLDEALQQVALTPSRRVTADLARLDQTTGAGAWARVLGGDPPAALRRLGRAARAYFDVALGPCWSQVRAGVEGERSRLARVIVDRGLEGMLAGLSPGTRWEPPELLMPSTVDVSLVVSGRSLVLLPSLFCSEPVTRLDPGLPPVLVVGITSRAGRIDLLAGTHTSGEAANRKLSALLGRTRAAVLQAAGTACTTSELARRVGTSLPSASQHAGVLREAGLITSTRHRNSVVHATTPLGTALLQGP
jgi:DNA-binding transcriptional ArsR family regulator